MPNHGHGIIVIVGAGTVRADWARAGFKPALVLVRENDSVKELMPQDKLRKLAVVLTQRARANHRYVCRSSGRPERYSTISHANPAASW